MMNPKFKEMEFFDRIIETVETEFNKLLSFESVGLGKSPKINAVVKKNELIVEAAAPGYKKEDLKVLLKENLLTISSVTSPTNRMHLDAERTYLYEIENTTFSRSFKIDTNTFDVSKIATKLENGILTITIPKRINPEKPAPEIVTVPIL